MIGDFGVPIAIFFMIAVDISISDAYTQVRMTLLLLLCCLEHKTTIAVIWTMMDFTEW